MVLQVQLFISQATPFEHRSFGEELALCKRYFHKTDQFGYFPVIRWASDVGGRLGMFQIAPEMRADPAVSVGGETWTTSGGYAGEPTSFLEIGRDSVSLHHAGSHAVNSCAYYAGGTLKLDAEL